MENISPVQFLQEIKVNGLQHSAGLPALVAYKHNGEDGWENSDDEHAGFREQVAEVLYEDFSAADKELIIYLLEAERTFCMEETIMTDTLRRLTFMLYLVGDVTDIPLLFAAKFETSFDALCGLDAELVFGRNREETVSYFTEHRHPEYDIAGEISQRDSGDYLSPEAFIEAMRYYFAS